MTQEKTKEVKTSNETRTNKGVRPNKKSIINKGTRLNNEIKEDKEIKTNKEIKSNKEIKTNLANFNLDKSNNESIYKTVNNLWIWGKPGCGKTYYATSKYPNHYLKLQNKW